MDIQDLSPPFILVKARHGIFLVNRNDRYIGRSLLLYGEYAELEWKLMRQAIAPGRDIVEVGANMGSHSVALGKLAADSGRRLMVVEPQQVVFQNLCANLALNGLLNVQAENCACAESPALVSFPRMDYSAPNNFGGVGMQRGQAGGQTVRALPLDDLLGADWDVGFLKIDVEGFERDVLLGAAKTLARCRPVIYLENDQPDKSAALLELLWAQDYVCWYDLPALFNPDNFAGVTEDIFPTVVSMNMLCVPRERPHSIDFAPITPETVHPLVLARAQNVPG